VKYSEFKVGDLFKITKDLYSLNEVHSDDHYYLQDKEYIDNLISLYCHKNTIFCIDFIEEDYIYMKDIVGLGLEKEIYFEEYEEEKFSSLSLEFINLTLNKN
jgi:hypothetical protein